MKNRLRGGEGGIRTLDGVAPIPPFQDGALDQLCDLSPLGIFNACGSRKL
jgi:hypothetical protein